MYCGHTGLVKSVGPVTQVLKFRCKTWACPHCQKKLRRRLIARAKKGKPQRLITLTVNPAHFETPDEAARALTSAWRRARQQLKRHHRHKSIEFLAVFEEHKSGWPHLHILARCGYIAQKWLSRYMRERIASPIVDLRKIRSAKHAAIYVAKYIAKAPKRFEGCKRFWTSKHYAERPPKPPKDPRAVWSIARDAHLFMRSLPAEFHTAFEVDGITPPFWMVDPSRLARGAPP